MADACDIEATSDGKFVVHICVPQKSRKFLHIVPKTIWPCMWRKGYRRLG
jgi:hypothetical protein